MKKRELLSTAETPRVGESIFYVIVLLAVVPTVTDLIREFFFTNFLSESDVIAMGLTGSIDTLITAIIAVFGLGAQAVCSKDAGKGDAMESSRSYTSIMAVELTVVVILGLLITIFSTPLSMVIGAEEDTAYQASTAKAIAYFGIGMIPNAFLALFNVLFYLDKSVRRCVLYVTASLLVLNIGGLAAVTYTVGPSMDAYMIVGIAAEAVCLAFALFFNHRKGKYFRFKLSLFSWKRFLRIFSVGLPGGLEYVYYAMYQFLIFRYVLNRFSPHYMATFELYEDLSMISEMLVAYMCVLLIDRFGLAAGSGDERRFSREYKYSWIICVSASVVIGAVLAFVYPALAELFAGDYGANRESIVQNASISLICLCIGLPFYVAINIFTSLYEVKEMLMHAHLNYFLEIFVFITLYTYILGESMGILGVWIAYPLSEITTLLVNFIALAIHRRRLPRSWHDLEYPDISFNRGEKDAS